jgi:hypothetical protein
MLPTGQSTATVSLPHIALHSFVPHFFCRGMRCYRTSGLRDPFHRRQGYECRLILFLDIVTVSIYRLVHEVPDPHHLARPVLSDPTHIIEPLIIL